MQSVDRLILLFSELNPDKNRLIKARELLKIRLNWRYILKKSEQEGVACLVYYHLENNGFLDFVPVDIREKLKLIYYSNSVRNTLIYEEMERLASIFNQNKIKIIFLKGVFLAESLYKNIALRPMSDIDMLIDRNDFLRVGEVLRTYGYIGREDCLSTFNNPFAYSVLFGRKDSPRDISFLIDLHWDILTSTWMRGLISDKDNLEKIWSEAEEVRVGNVNTLVLSYQHHLLHICLHAFSHSFERVIMLTDILGFLDYYRDKINWSDTVREARLFGLDGILSYSIYFASRKLDSRLIREISPQFININSPRNSFLYFIQSKARFYGFACLIYILFLNKVKKVVILLVKITPLIGVIFNKRFRS